MFCEKCGHQIPEGARFCPSCGTSVRMKNPQSMQDNPFRTARTATVQSTVHASHHSSKIWVGIILAIIIFVALVAIGNMLGGPANQQSRTGKSPGKLAHVISGPTSATAPLPSPTTYIMHV
jgi:uncharacterized membrane protein YvbJ